MIKMWRLSDIDSQVRLDLLRLIKRGWNNSIIASIISRRHKVSITPKDVAELRLRYRDILENDGAGN